MDVKISDQKKEKISFTIKGTDHVLVNTLRRMILEEVPTLAIEDINCIDNTSALSDEMLALRLGLIPLVTDLKSYVLPEEAKNELDPRTFLNFKMKVTGPKTVLASDLNSQDSKVQPVYPEMIIAKLLEKQAIELEATAILGSGKRHMKFAPGLAYFYNTPIVKVKQKDAGEFKEKYPTQIFNSQGQIDPKLITSIQIIDACKNINPDIIDIKEEEDSFEFNIESWGQLSIKEIITQSIKLFEGKLDDFEEQIKKSK